MTEIYKFPKERKKARPERGKRVHKQRDKEALTGFIGDKEASDIEERFARALYKKGIEFSFEEHYFGPARTTPGAIELDFMVKMGAMWYPVQIDGEFSHKTIGQKAEDAVKDTRLNAYFGRFGGIAHVTRIPDGKKYMMNALDTQDGADRIVNSLFA